MKTNLKNLMDGAETLADILRDYEVHDSHDCEMLKDGRLPKGQDKFIGIARLLALEKELRERIAWLEDHPIPPCSELRIYEIKRILGETDK